MNFKTLLVAFILFAFKEESCLQMDLILIGDLSGSVIGYEKFVSDAFTTMIESNDVDENFQIGIITFNDGGQIVSKLSPDKPQLMRDALSIKTRSATGSTFMSSALQLSLSQFVDHGVINHKKMIILVTDGTIDDNYEASLLIARLKQLGIMFCGVMIRDGSANPEFFRSVCGECFVESDYENLIKEIKRLDVCL